MNLEQQIDKHLDNSNNSAAFALYQEHRHQHIFAKTLVRLARAYYVQQEYRNCLSVLSNASNLNPPTAYEMKALQFKCEYLSQIQCTATLKTLQDLIRNGYFQNQQHLRAIVKEFEGVYEYRDLARSVQQRRQEGLRFVEMYRSDEARGAFAFEGFPMFLVSRRWFDMWKSYVFLDDTDQYNSVDASRGQSPGTISQFELLDHQANVLYDTDKQKDYTNRYLFEGVPYELLTKDCWLLLQRSYGGIPICRYNISLYEKPSEVITEVSLQKLLVAKSTSTSERFWVQICRKQTWEALVRKIQQSFGKGRLWKYLPNNSRSLVGLKSVIEDQDLSRVELIYEQGTYFPGESTANTTSNPKMSCASCGKQGQLSFCSCRMVKYCNEKCLADHRSKHRKLCETKKSQETKTSQLISNMNLKVNQEYANKMGLVGLVNLGNTCYMNSGIQCLSNTREFTDYFMSSRFIADINSTNPLGSNGYIVCTYSKLIRSMWSGKDHEVSPWELKRAISTLAPQFAGYGQHDAQELVSTLLDGLHQDTNLVKVKVATTTEDDDNRSDEKGLMLAQQNYAKRNRSFISSLTVGFFKSTAKCPPCGRVSKNFDPFMMVSLPVPSTLLAHVFFFERNCPDIPTRFTFVIKSIDDVEDIAARIRELKQIKFGYIKFYGLDSNFKMMREFRPRDKAQDFRPFLMFAYEIDCSQSEEVVRVDYFIEKKGEYRHSYPHFLCVPKGPLTKDRLEAIVQSDVKKYKIPDMLRYCSITLESSGIVVRVSEVVKLNREIFLPQRDEIESRRQLTISDCFALFQKEEQLDKDNAWYCSTCKKFVEAFKQIEIFKANRILMVGLKRFRHGRKLKSFVSFPVDSLDMGPYITSNYDKRPIMYDLYAVANHYGNIHSGHYTAFCKNFINGQWFEFNDTRVDGVREDQIITSNAYALFYRLRA